MHLDDLPVEILRLIFEESESDEFTWANLREACRKFFDIVHPMIWEHIYFNTNALVFGNKQRYWQLSTSNILFEPEKLINFVNPSKEFIRSVELHKRDFDYGLSTELEHYLLSLPNLYSIKISSSDAIFIEPEGRYLMKKLENKTIDAAQLDFEIYLKSRIDPVNYRDILDGLARLNRLDSISDLQIFAGLVHTRLTHEFKEFLGSISPPVTILSLLTVNDESMDSIRDLLTWPNLSSTLSLEINSAVSEDPVKRLTLSPSVEDLSLRKSWPPIDDSLTLEGGNVSHISATTRTLSMCRLDMPKLNALTLRVNSIAVPSMLINLAETCSGTLGSLVLAIEDYMDLDSLYPLVRLVKEKLRIKIPRSPHPFGVSKVRRLLAGCLRLLKRGYQLKQLEIDSLGLDYKDLALFLLEATEHMKSLEMVKVIMPYVNKDMLVPSHSNGNGYEGYRDCFVRGEDASMKADLSMIREYAGRNGDSMDPYSVSESFTDTNLALLFG